MNAKFVLSKKVLREQIQKLENLGLKISYLIKQTSSGGCFAKYERSCKFLNPRERRDRRN
jgi:hypothetical protein